MIFTRGGFLTTGDIRSVLKFAEERELYLPIDLDRVRISEFCRKWKIEQMWLFGSVLTERFRPDSDVDFLVRFADDENWSLFDVIDAEEELKTIVGRDVDLVDLRSIERSENWIRRRSILESAVPLYTHG